MAFPVIIRRHGDTQSYLVLDDHPRELLRHPGFSEEYSIRRWLGSVDPADAREEWSEMLAEEIDFYVVTDSDNWEYCHDQACWDHCRR